MSCDGGRQHIQVDDAGERLNFKGVLILNWRNGDMRVVKKCPNSKNPAEFMVNFNIEVEVPEFHPPTMEGTIIVPKHKVRKMLLKGEDVGE